MKTLGNKNNQPEYGLIIIDAMNLFHRQFHTFGKYPYGTAYGFVNSLLGFKQMLGSNCFVVCWEGDKNWRKEESSEYKEKRGNRFTEDEKENFNLSIKYTKQLLSKIGVLQVLKRDCEADDLIGYLAVHSGKNTAIISNDKDFMQLIDDKKNIIMLRPVGKGEYKIFKEANVKEHYGVPAKKIASYLAIAGDVGDGVKGVHGFGPKKAIELINKDLIKTEKLKEVFTPEQLKQFIKSYKLVKLGTDKFHHIKLNDEDFLEEELSIKTDEYVANLQQLMDKFQIKKYKAIELKALLNVPFKTMYKWSLILNEK